MRALLGFLSAKILFLIKPDLKHVVKKILFGAIIIILILYLHNEFLKWSQFSNNIEYVSFSFILKNILIILTLVVVFALIRKTNKKYDGFDKFRDREIKIEDKKSIPENVSTKEIDDAYFERFRTKKKLRSTREIKLEKEKNK